MFREQAALGGTQVLPGPGVGRAGEPRQPQEHATADQSRHLCPVITVAHLLRQTLIYHLSGLGTL